MSESGDSNDDKAPTGHFGCVLEAIGNFTTAEHIKATTAKYVKDKLFPKVKFIQEGSNDLMNAVSKEARRELQYSKDAWPALYTSVVFPAIQKAITHRRSNIAQKIKNRVMTGESI